MKQFAGIEHGGWKRCHPGRYMRNRYNQRISPRRYDRGSYIFWDEERKVYDRYDFGDDDTISGIVPLKQEIFDLIPPMEYGKVLSGLAIDSIVDSLIVDFEVGLIGYSFFHQYRTYSFCKLAYVDENGVQENGFERLLGYSLPHERRKQDLDLELERKRKSEPKPESMMLKFEPDPKSTWNFWPVPELAWQQKQEQKQKQKRRLELEPKPEQTQSLQIPSWVKSANSIKNKVLQKLNLSIKKSSLETELSPEASSVMPEETTDIK
jgi:hypothetical protein